MRSKKIDVKNKSLLVVSPLYNKTDKLYAINSLINENRTIAFLGDTCHPYDKFSEVPPRINQIREFMEGKDAHYVLGDKDLTYAQKTFSTHVDNREWLALQQGIIKFVFQNQTSALVLHGGILPRHTTWSELVNDMEVVFIANNPSVNKPWHKQYNGRFGYVLSAHGATNPGEVEMFNHSIALDTLAYESNKVAVQEFTENGLGETFYV